jgi:DNA-binding NtrC family response regulator
MRVLVAEDDRAMCDIYRIALQAKGHEVVLSYDGRQCVGAYRAGQPFDAVVLDYRMPEMDGLETAKEILKINKKQRLIFASAFANETLKDSVKHLDQVMEIIQKPFEPKVLVELVQDISTTRQLEEINRMVSAMDRSNPDDAQIGQLLDILKKIQKVGLC